MNRLENLSPDTHKEKRKKTPNASKMGNLICIAISFSKINFNKTKQNNIFLLLFMRQILYKDLPEFLLLLCFTILKK